MSVFAAVPAFPMSFYGSVTINGVAAPTGTIVRAYYGSTLSGQAVVNEAGVYGYNSPIKQQLLVGEGSGAIRFTVQAGVINGGQETEGLVAQTHTSFVSGDAMEKNLVFTFTNPVSSVTPAPATGGGGGGGGGGGSYSSPVAAVQPTSVSVATTTTVVPSPIITAAKPAGQVLGATAFVFSKNLTVGSRGVDITELQKVLIAGGFLAVSPTGYFGPVTKAAVIAYQKFNNIFPASGFVGILTRAQLNNTNTLAQNQILAPATFTFLNNLGLGARGNDVTELQKILSTEGFLKVSPTGYFGILTKEAVAAYQKTHGIIPASGYIGPLTRAELNK